jgi:hypothetical protein
VLVGRYRLDERVDTNPDGSLWRAVDSTLDRKVTIRVLRPGHPFAADVADAARRAALVDDPRLVRVLDVGTDGDIAYVVSEHVAGDTLEALVGPGPLPPPVVRRLVGEAAETLARAGSRGLHHLRLTPRSLVVRPDGSVKLLGTAVEAAAAGLEPDHAATASRVDAVALAGLVYAGLTGRWPLGDAGFAPAPRTGSGPVPPADLVADVPNDLDTLCVVTLGRHNDGPRTPAELAQQLAPWPSPQEAPLPARGRGRAAPPAASRAPAPSGQGSVAAEAVAGSSPAPPPAAPATPGGAAAAGNGTSASRLPTRAPGRTASSLPPPLSAPPAASSGRSGTGAPAGRPTRAPLSNDLFTPAVPVADAPEPEGPPGTPSRSSAAAAIASSHAARAAGAGARPAPAGSTAAAAGNGDSTPATPPEPVAPERAATRPDALPAAAPAARATAPPAAPPAATTSGVTASGAPSVGGATPGKSRAPRKTVPVKKVAKSGTGQGGAGGARSGGPRRPRPSQLDTGEQLLPWADRWTPADVPPDPLETTGPFPLVIPQERPPEEQSRFVIFAVAGVVLLVLLVAVFSVRGLFASDDDGDGAASPAPSLGTPSGGAPSPSGPAPSTPQPSVSLPSFAGPQIAAVRALDPEGDGDEDTRRTPRAVDGDPETTWRSQQYNSAEFGGLKDGVGLSLRLQQPAVVRTVQLDVKQAGGTVEIRTGDTPDVSKSTVVATQDISGEQVTVTTQGATAKPYVILWFTSLPKDGGKYRIEVSEVRVT